jgi:hypothetical protein
MFTRILPAILAFTPPAARAEALPAVVSHVKVLSDKVPDLSSIEAWKKSYLKEGMNDREKALAVWRSVVSFQHQESPPMEFLQAGGSVQDPIKMANVYGYSLCSVTSAHVQALARAAGLKARGWTLNAHVVPEVMWDGKWHLLDASLITYFPRADGELAGVEEIVRGVKEWYDGHPEFKGSDGKLREFMRGGGWRKGPAVLSRATCYDENGWLPAATHGWYSTMQEYDGSTLFEFEAGYSTGYQVNVQLRPGERLTRNWSHKGLHINMDGSGGTPGVLGQKTGTDSLRYTPEFGDIAPGRIGNGTLEYEVPLTGGEFSRGVLSAYNVVSAPAGKTPALRVSDTSIPGGFTLRMPSSYVYLGGELTVQCVVPSGGDIRVELSDNHGLDWPVYFILKSGSQRIDLKPFVFRRYDYRLRFTVKGAGTSIEKLRLTHDIQHSQRPLPALSRGDNTITFQSGPQEGTITLEGSTELQNKKKQLVFTEFHPVAEHCETDAMRPKGRSGSLTFPVITPGDITRLRIHTFYRARDPKDGWDVLVSFDGGKSFRSAAKLSGPVVMMGHSVTVSDVPAGTRTALVRYAGTQVNTAAVLNFRIDADYLEPLGGFRPVRVTYVWEENGTEKRHEHTAAVPNDSYTIPCAAVPVMKSLSLELAR